MKKLRAIMLFALCLPLLVCGCSEVKATGENYNGRFSLFDCRVQNGQLVYGEEGMNEFLSYENMKTVPLCIKPDCNHTANENCLGANKENGEFIHDGQLYWFENSTELKNDKPVRTLKFKCSLVTGYNERTALSIDNARFESAAVPCVKNDDMLYFTPVFYDDDKPSLHLSEIDLKRNKFTDLAVIGDTGEALVGYFSGKLFFKTFYFDTEKCEFGEINMLFTDIIENGSFAIFDGYFVYDTQDGIHIAKENGTDIILENEKLDDSVAIFDDKLFNTFYDHKPYYINLAGNDFKRTQFESPIGNAAFTIYNQYKDYFILYVAREYFDEENGMTSWQVDYEKVPKTDITGDI